MTTVIPALTVAAAVGAGLMAGLFFTFSNSVMAGLGRIPPAQGMAAMRAINETILNPLFFLAFMGTGLICLALAAEAMFRLQHPGAVYVLVGCGLYLVGSIGVTMLANVPLNNELAALDPEATQSSSFWARYLDVWTKWNHVRTIACTASMIALIAGFCWPEQGN